MVRADNRVAFDVDADQSQRPGATAQRFREHVAPELPVLLRVARRLTGQPSDAEDLVQETVIRAYRAIDRFDGRYPRAWLLTIMRNTWRNMNRKARPQIADTAEAMMNVPAEGAEGRTGPEERVLDGMLEAELADALRDLSPVYREVVLLVDVDGLTYQEAADVLAVPNGTVMSRLHRARKKLRKQLEAAGFSPTGGSS